MLHSVMMTSTPALHYWEAASVTVMQAVRAWRADGLSVCYSVDAGPNVHVLCPAGVQKEAETRLRSLPGVVDVLSTRVGGAARLLE
jgi:diphosphomevalonate decarboxylase